MHFAVIIADAAVTILCAVDIISQALPPYATRLLAAPLLLPLRYDALLMLSLRMRSAGLL